MRLMIFTLVAVFLLASRPSRSDARELLDGGKARLNLRPLIGILSQPGGPAPADHSYIAASYVKFLEASGGRAVPFEYDLSPEEIARRFQVINGVLIPGGGAYLGPQHPFYDAAAQLVKLALEANDQGDYFPVHGTCLGMEALSIILSQPLNTSLLTFSDSEDNPSRLILTDAADQSRFFSSMPAHVLENLQNEALAMENHHWGLSHETFLANEGLREFFTVTSFSLDKAGSTYISSMESPKYPVTATQWHPEKNSFEWAAGLQIPHSPQAIEVTQAVSNFIVDEARRNHHSPENREEEIDLLINTHPIYFTGKAKSTGIESGFDECYFFPKRQKPESGRSTSRILDWIVDKTPNPAS